MRAPLALSLFAILAATSSACVEPDAGTQLVNADGKADGDALARFKLESFDDVIPAFWFDCDETLWCDVDVSLELDDWAICRAARAHFEREPGALAYEARLLAVDVTAVAWETGEVSARDRVFLDVTAERNDSTINGCGAVDQRLVGDDGSEASLGRFGADDKVTLDLRPTFAETAALPVDGTLSVAWD